MIQSRNIDAIRLLEQYFPLAKEEQIQSTGCYLYYCNNQMMTVMEPWLITKIDQHVIYRSMREASAYQTQIYVMSTQRYGSSDTQIIYKQGSYKKEVTYYLEKQRLLMHEHAEDAQLSMNLTPDSVFFPLLRIFTGPVLHAARRDTAEVVVPLIAEGTSRQQLLSPTISKRKSRFIGDEQLIIDGKQYAAQKWEYQGDRYGDGTYFWLDADQVLLSYVWPKSKTETWKIVLNNYETTAHSEREPEMA